MCCFEWLGRLKCLATGLDASLSFFFHVAKVFSESVTQSSSCFTYVELITISASFAVNNIGGGTRKVISDLNGSLGSR